MIEAIIAKRYARALLLVARERDQDQVDLYGNQLRAFTDMCTSSAVTLEVLSDHFRDLGERKRAVIALSSKLDLNKDVTEFLKLLISKGRMELLPIVQQEYQKMADAHMNRVMMTVVSASELSANVYGELATLFAQKTGKKMMLAQKIDASVLGGVRVHVGDQVFDYTLSHQLEQLKSKMLA